MRKFKEQLDSDGGAGARVKGLMQVAAACFPVAKKSPGKARLSRKAAQKPGRKKQQDSRRHALMLAGRYNSMDITRIVLSAYHEADVLPMLPLDSASFAAVLGAQHDHRWLKKHLRLNSLARCDQLQQVGCFGWDLVGFCKSWSAAPAAHFSHTAHDPSSR